MSVGALGREKRGVRSRGSGHPVPLWAAARQQLLAQQWLLPRTDRRCLGEQKLFVMAACIDQQEANTRLVLIATPTSASRHFSFTNPTCCNANSN